MKMFKYFIILSTILFAQNKEILFIKKMPTRGKAPVYELSIYNDSTAILKGIANLQYIGLYKANIQKNYYKIKNLIDSIQLDTLQEKYNYLLLDYPVTIMKITKNNIEKTVKFKRDAPNNLKNISKIANNMIKNEKWIKIEEGENK
ncbi:MAG TPA: DUF6438 domain-containing protein [Ignavibacteriales bacterium]|nr:DUF6438 domain-containing protein [Ignavibacteriales bacterium]